MSAVAARVVEVLRNRGVDRVFCVAGESYLALLDALGGTPEIHVVTCRHEGSAGFAAIADAKLTGRAGVCLVSRGPGAANAAIAVHAAREDATALVVVVGQVRRGELGTDAFQAIDCRSVFESMAKAVWTVVDPAATASAIDRALALAEEGRPGPVVVAVPVDVMASDDGGAVPVAPTQPHGLPEAGTLEEVLELLERSDRPLLVAGGRLDTPAGRRALAGGAKRHGLAVACSNKHQDLADNRAPFYAGHLTNSTPRRQLAELARADAVLAVGTRLDPVTAAGRPFFPTDGSAGPPLVHVYPDETVLAGPYRPAIAVCADAVAFMTGLARARRTGGTPARRAWVERLHEGTVEQAAWTPLDAPDGVVFGAVVHALDRLTGGRVVVTVDSGGFTSWVYRYLRLSRGGRLLGIASSAMGFGLAAGVAAALRVQDRPVVAVVGDGGLLMNGGELATAAAEGVRLVVLVANNGSYGTIRHHQERVYPGRPTATDLVNPDFVRLAEAHGALGLRVEDELDVEAALAKAIAHPGLSLVDVRTSLRHFSAGALLGGAAT